MDKTYENVTLFMVQSKNRLKLKVQSELLCTQGFFFYFFVFVKAETGSYVSPLWGRHIVFPINVCLSICAVCLSVTNRVHSITLKLFEIFSHNLVQM